MSSIIERARKGWNAFLGRDPTSIVRYDDGFGIYGENPYRHRMSILNTRTMINSIFNRIAVNVAAININHVMVDENDNYKETIRSSLNNLLTVEANQDQTGREFIQDIVMSMFDEGHVAIVPIETSANIWETEAYKVYTARVGKVIEWKPTTVKVEVWRSDYQRKEQIILPKRAVPIIENPFYSIMNERNSTLQRLNRLINQLDRSNDVVSSDRLNLVVQLPYVIRTEPKRREAEKRLREIEVQLSNSKHGIVYTDGTERIVQLNRSLENNLWTQVKELQTELFNHFGLTEKVFNGTANEKEMLNYYDSTIEPIVSAISDNISRKWISERDRSRGQRIKYFRNPFKLVPVTELAEIADKMTRNEIMSSNELRSVLGMKPSDDPRANQLINANLNHPEEKETKMLNNNDQLFQNNKKGGVMNNNG